MTPLLTMSTITSAAFRAGAASSAPSDSTMREVVDAVVEEELARQVRVLGGDAQVAPAPPELGRDLGDVDDAADVDPALGDGQHQGAAGVAERLLEHQDAVVLALVLADDVVAGDAEIDAALGDLREDVGGALEQHLDARAGPGSWRGTGAGSGG